MISARRRRCAGASALAGLSADEVARGSADDELRRAATRVQDLNEDRFVEASIPLERIDPDGYPIGGQVRRIDGIEVDLSVTCGGASRYPRIVARTFRLSPDRLGMDLILDTDRQRPVL